MVGWETPQRCHGCAGSNMKNPLRAALLGGRPRGTLRAGAVCARALRMTVSTVLFSFNASTNSCWTWQKEEKSRGQDECTCNCTQVRCAMQAPQLGQPLQAALAVLKRSMGDGDKARECFRPPRASRVSPSIRASSKSTSKMDWLSVRPRAIIRRQSNLREKIRVA